MNSNSNSDASACPSTKLLQDWLGNNAQLTPDILQHLQGCARCSRLLDSLTDDLDLKALKRSEEALESLKVSDVTLNRYAQLIQNTPDSLYAIALNQYELSKCYLSLNRLDEGIVAIQKSMAMTEDLLKNQPDYLPSRMHQVDELIAFYELLEAREESDSQELIKTVQRGFEVSSKLLADTPELPDYEVAHSVLYSALSTAHLRQQQIVQAITAAQHGIDYLQSLDADTETETVREAFQRNYLALAKALQAQWSGFGPQQQQEQAEIMARFEEALVKCTEFGANQEIMTTLPNGFR
jgi:tetratricopeptide (TPR) repeat protein